MEEQHEKYNTDTLDSKIALLEESKKQIDKFKGQLEKIYESYESGIYDSVTFLERQKLMSAKISDTEQSITNLNKEIQQEREFINSQEQIIPRAKKVLEIYRTCDDVQLKNDLIKSIVDKVVYVKTANGKFKDQKQEDFSLELFPKLPKNKGISD